MREKYRRTDERYIEIIQNTCKVVCSEICREEMDKVTGTPVEGFPWLEQGDINTEFLQLILCLQDLNARSAMEDGHGLITYDGNVHSVVLYQ